MGRHERGFGRQAPDLKEAFRTRRAAEAFAGGYVSPHVVIKTRGGYDAAPKRSSRAAQAVQSGPRGGAFYLTPGGSKVYVK